MPGKQEQRKRCFVIGVIGDDASPERIHADWLLHGIIIPVFQEHFAIYDVERADRIARPGMIDSQIINLLLDAELVIADMSWLNANAFYEMGIRHMAQKPIIHMFRTTDPIPFDVKPHRAIPFAVSRPRDLEDAKNALKDAVIETEKTGFQVENPVTRARGIVKLKEHATPTDVIIHDELRQMHERLLRLEAEGLRSRSAGTFSYRVSITVDPAADYEKVLETIAATAARIKGIFIPRVEKRAKGVTILTVEGPDTRSADRFMMALGQVPGVRSANVMFD